MLPDGCMDLLWTGDELLVSGPDTEPFDYVSSGGRMVGVRFDPGVAPTVFDCAAEDLRDSRVAFDNLVSTTVAGRWLDEVAAARMPGEAMVGLLVARSRSLELPSWTAVLVASLLDGEQVADCARELALTERTLHRRSLRHFGYGPKTLQRILRMQAARGRLAAGGQAGDVVERCGYADYAHMYRDFVELTGRGPLTFMPPGD